MKSGAFRSARQLSAGARSTPRRTNTATVGGADWDGVRFTGTDGRREFLAVVVRLRIGSGALMRKFDRYLAFNTVDAECVDADVGDVWLCWGHPDAVSGLTTHPAVIEWHYPMSGSVPARAAGSGAVK